MTGWVDFASWEPNDELPLFSSCASCRWRPGCAFSLCLCYFFCVCGVSFGTFPLVDHHETGWMDARMTGADRVASGQFGWMHAQWHFVDLFRVFLVVCVCVCVRACVRGGVRCVSLLSVCVFWSLYLLRAVPPFVEERRRRRRRRKCRAWMHEHSHGILLYWDYSSGAPWLLTVTLTIWLSCVSLASGTPLLANPPRDNHLFSPSILSTLTSSITGQYCGAGRR